MHQPIPPIAPRHAAKSISSDLFNPVHAKKNAVPQQVLFALLIAFVVAYAGFNLPFFHHAPPHYAPVTLGKIEIDPDGDDPRQVLLYHWQDPKFSVDEQRGIAWMANGLALLGIWRIGKRMAKDSKK